MEEILKQVNAVVGVIGSFVCQPDGTIVAHAVPANINVAQLELAARVTAQTFQALDDCDQHIHDVDLSFEQGRLFLKNLDTGILAIFCARSINIPLLNLAANAAVKKLTIELKSTKPPAARAPVAPISSATIAEAPLPPLIAELEQEARRLIDEGKRNRLRLRAMNRVAIWLACPHHRNWMTPAEQKQIDFAAASSDSHAIEQIFEWSGYVGEKLFNSLYGNRRLHFTHDQKGVTVDVYLDKFEMFHQFDLLPFLSEDDVLFPPTGLILSRLQYVEIGDAELRELCALLLENDLSISAGKGKIDATYITRLCAEDWGWFKTVSLNLDRVSTFALSNLPDTERTMVIERAQRLRQSMETAPKSLRWQTRARLGTGVKWYETPLAFGEQHERPDLALG